MRSQSDTLSESENSDIAANSDSSNIILSEFPRLLTLNETLQSLQLWINEVTTFIASDPQFESLVVFRWGRPSRSSPHRAFTDDDPSCQPSRSAAQKCIILDAMLAQIYKLCSNVIRTRFHKRVSCLQDIWSELYVYFGFSPVLN